VIDYNINKFAYTDGSQFKLNSVPYVGYYNVKDGQAYTNRIYSSDSKLLTSSFIIDSDIALSEYFKDRIPTSSFVLPYQFKDVEIPPGETLNARLINDRLYKIYQNFLYTYTKCFIPLSVDPFNPVSVAATRFGAFVWQTDYANTSFASIPEGIGLQGLDQSSKILTVPYNRDNSKYTLIAAFSGSNTLNSRLVIADAGDPTVNLQNIPGSQGVLQYDYIDVETNKYKNITGLATLNNLLFVCDAGNNQIYKYNIADLLNQDRLTTFKRVYVESIGGIGTANDNAKFNNPSKVYAVAAIDRVFVVDSGNNCIKIFDSNFIHKKSIFYPRNTNYVTQSIAFYEPQQLIYVLVYDASADNYFINIYDVNYNIVETLNGIISTNLINNSRKEQLKEIYFSPNNSNIMYIVGEQYVYKLYLNTMQQFAKWLPYILSNAQLKQQPDAGYIDISVVPGADNCDNIFAYGCTLSANYTGPVDRIWYVQDKVTLDTVVADRVVNFYTLNNFGINNSELLQGFVLNKELFKMTYNIFTLRNLIRGKFAIKFDVANNVVSDNYGPLSDQEIDLISVNYNQNMFVHENENMQSPDALNRVLEKIYNIQDSLLTVVNAVYTNIAFSTTPGTSAVVL